MSNTKGTTSINSPKGGGALSGLGEKFSPDLFTGTGNFSVPIAVPPGRNGLQPELTIGYSTGNGNGLFGMGWALGIPGVTRKTTKGIPVYDDKTDIFILSGAEDLVPVKSETETEDGTTHEKTYYRPRTEGLFARIVRHKKSDGAHWWEVRSKDGLISWYGTPDTTAGNDPCVTANPEKRDSIYAWHLSKTRDPFGNEIVYEYERELVTSGEHPYDQLYISNIKYAQYRDGANTKYLCLVKFGYETRPDPFSAYRQGFEIRTTKRCAWVEMWTDALAPVKTKTYRFDYRNDDPNGATLLKSVRVEGHDGAEGESMPPLEFRYSPFEPQKRNLHPVKGELPGVSLADPGFELVDLDGNGLPDILQLNGISRRWPNLGNGKFGPPLSLDVEPSVRLGMPGVRLIDADGDGKSDLLVSDGIKAGYFPGRFRTVWDNKSFRPYPQVPSFSFDDPEVQLIDLDGDGVTDVLRNGSRFECFFNDPEKGFHRTRFTSKTFADFSFADPRIRFADMTGDGMQDIVLITSGKVQYWPNLGYGRFGNRMVMRNAPRFPQEYNPAQVLLGDLDGDGLADLAFVEDGRVTLYVNRSGNAFSEPVTVKGTPRFLTSDALRITDLYGTGQSGILWSYGAGEYTTGQMFFLDFTAGNKPYLLEEMNNNMGSLTRVKYGSSVHHYLRDEKRPETRWQTDLPFPVSVVDKVEVLDLLSGGKMVTEYLYHHGYWDGAEREFRGFARVDVHDTETFERYNTEDLFTENFAHVSVEHYTPPTETRNWFYPGPVGDGYGKWFEPDFTHEYWQGDTPVFDRPRETADLLASLPRRARRDALRTLRRTMLRSELYALDGTPLKDRPYTVTESVMGIRKEFEPSENPGLTEVWAQTQTGRNAGSGYIFFPLSVAQRTTQWERGDDPMHSFSFTHGHDAYGQPTAQMGISVPRGADPLRGGQGEYLATYGTTEFIYADTPTRYMTDRVKRGISYDATYNANGTSVFALRDLVFNGQITLPVIGCTLNFYDGPAFDGLPYGQIGDYGAMVRSESLVITDAVIAQAYGNDIPECFKPTPDWGDTNGYPAAFAGLLQNGDVRLGYKDRRVGHPNYIPGWYAEGVRMQYDFHVLPPQEAVGLTLETRDTFDNRSTVEYDTYRFLPEKTRQWLNATDYLESSAEYDYRTFQVRRMTDPNENISVFDYSPLGLLRATALIGKGTEGDYKSGTGTFYERYAPSVRMEYDFFAFQNAGNPAWVKTIQREQHYQQNPGSETIVKVEYSDGFGRLLQTRAQAEDVIFGNRVFGSSGLPADQTVANSPAVGTERNPNDPLNVTVSGWQVYNNKGAVVEQYEPFFDQGFDYALPQNLGVKVKMYYDPRGQAVRTLNPDKTEQWVIFGVPPDLAKPDVFAPTPWESYTYDANDLAPLTHPGDSTVPVSHHFTPQSVLLDALGRSIRTTEHTDKTNIPPVDDIVMRYRYDIRGNLLEVIDPYGRNVFEYLYDLADTALKTTHIDGGISYALTDATGKPIEASDAKIARTLASYDVLQRPTHAWTQNNDNDSLRLTVSCIYGEMAPTPQTTNLLGKPWQVYDESGKIESVTFDFKGNLLSKQQQVISSAVLKTSLDNYQTYLVDWTGLPNILEAKIFETSSEYDALNRATKITLPENVNSDRKEIVPTYNRSGALEKVHYDGTEYVENIAYNAKGQRLLITFGNNVMTRYVYNNRTFRLERQKSEKYTKTTVGDTITYTPASGTTRQDDRYIYDLIGNIFNINIRTTACGVGGTNSLDRAFGYDSLYRLTEATGRENVPGGNYPFPGWGDTTRDTDPNTTEAYTRKYQYDKLGNILTLQQIGNNAFTRTYGYASGQNILNSVSIGSNAYAYTYDATGNLLTENTDRQYEWDAANRLVCFKNRVGSAEPTVMAQYLYNAAGNRVKKIVRKQGGNYEIRTYIDGVFEHYTDETDEQNTVHVMDGRSRIATVRIGDAMGDTTPAVKYNLENNIGSSAVCLDDGGSVVNTQEYYPFGETSFGSYGKKRYQYVGKERDGESGLYYYGARYYSPWICRFISIDPLAEKYPFYNPYNYAGNKPINFVDLDGLQEGSPPQDGGGGNDNLNPQGGGAEGLKPHQFTTPGGATVTFQESYKATTDLGGTATLESGNKVELAPGVLTNFEVNGTTYNAFFQRTGDGPYSFAGYRDADKNVYNNFKESGATAQKGNSAPDVGENTVKPQALAQKSENGDAAGTTEQPRDTTTNTAAGLPDWMGNANTGIGAFSIVNGVKTELMDYAIRQNYKSARTWSEFNKLRSTQQTWRATNTLGKTGASYLKGAKVLGKGAFAFTVVNSSLNAGSAFYNDDPNKWGVAGKAVLDVTMGYIGFLGPIGFGISAAYFILDASGAFNSWSQPTNR